MGFEVREYNFFGRLSVLGGEFGVEVEVFSWAGKRVVFWVIFSN